MEAWVGGDLEATLQWARARAERLIAGLHDAELLGLLSRGDRDPSPLEVGAEVVPQRAEVVPEVVRVAAPTPAPPSRLRPVESSPTPVFAEPAVDRDAQRLAELRRQRDRMERRSDAEVLGVSTDAGPVRVEEAFAELAARWHPQVAFRDDSPAARELAGAIFLRLERAYRALRGAPVTRAAAPTPDSPRRVESKPVGAARPKPRTKTKPKRRRHRASPAEAVVAAAAPAQPVAPVAPRSAEPAERGHQRRQQRLQSLARRLRPSRALPGLRRVDTARAGAHRTTGGPHAQSSELTEALALVEARRWRDAIVPLQRAIAACPDAKLEALLRVVQARQAALERDFGSARRHYESVLRLDPDHAVAQRELLMISAMSG